MSGYKAGDLAKYFQKSEVQTEGGKKFAELLSKGTQGKMSRSKKGSVRADDNETGTVFKSKKRKNDVDDVRENTKKFKKIKGFGNKFMQSKEKEEVHEVPESEPPLSKKEQRKLKRLALLSSQESGISYSENVGSHNSEETLQPLHANSKKEKRWKNKNKSGPGKSNEVQTHEEEKDDPGRGQKATETENVGGSCKKKKRNRIRKSKLRKLDAGSCEVAENETENEIRNQFSVENSTKKNLKKKFVENSTNNVSVGEPNVTLDFENDEVVHVSPKKMKKRKNMIDSQQAASKKSDMNSDGIVIDASSPKKFAKQQKKRKFLSNKDSKNIAQFEYGKPSKQGKQKLVGSNSSGEVEISEISKQGDEDNAHTSQKKKKKNKRNKNAGKDFIPNAGEILEEPPNSQSMSKKQHGQKNRNRTEFVNDVAENETTVDHSSQENQSPQKKKKGKKFLKDNEGKGSNTSEPFGSKKKKKFGKSDVPGLTDEPKLTKFVPRNGQENDSEGEEEQNRANNNQTNKKSSNVKPFNRANDPEKENRTLFFGNIPLSMTKESVEKIFRNFGDVESIRFRSFIPVKSTTPRKFAERRKEINENVTAHFGYVVFKDREDAKKAFELNGTVVNGNHIRVDWSRRLEKKHKQSHQKTVFIGNLPFMVDDETVWSTFSDCGDIVYARVIRDKDTGLGKGFGYVQFKEESSVQKALELNGTEILERKIRVQVCSETDQRKKKDAPNSDQSKKKKPFTPMHKKKKNHLGVSEGSHKSMKKMVHKRKQERQKKKIASVFKPFCDSLTKLKNVKSSL